MKYYRVKADLDNYPKYMCNHKDSKIERKGVLVGNELYTPAERMKIANSAKYFEVIEISSRNTYWLFGARFEYGKGPTTI